MIFSRKNHSDVDLKLGDNKQQITQSNNNQISRHVD